MKIGWVEWDEVEGPQGKLWADGRLLPTAAVRSSYLDPDNPERKTDPAIEAVFPLENRLFAYLLASWDSKREVWTISMLLWADGIDDPVGPDLEVDWKTSTVSAIPEEQSWRGTYGEDPEDVEEVFKILRRWSSLNYVRPAEEAKM